MEFARHIGVTKKHYAKKIKPVLEAAGVEKCPISRSRFRWHVAKAVKALQEAYGEPAPADEPPVEAPNAYVPFLHPDATFNRKLM